MNKEQFLAMSLPHKVKAIFTDEYGVVRIHELDHYLYQYMCDSQKDDTLYKFKLILHPLSVLTKPIEHNGEMFVPIKELCNLYGAKFDKPYQNNMCAGFIYGFGAHDVLNLKNIEKNEFWKIHKLIEWRFDVAGLIEKGEAVDVNTLPKNPYK